MGEKNNHLDSEKPQVIAKSPKIWEPQIFFF
jgi:hypothetical protein